MTSPTILRVHDPNRVRHRDDADQSDNSSTTSSELPTSRQPRKSQKTDVLSEKCAELEEANAKLQEKCDELEVRNEELAEEIAMLDGNIDHVQTIKGLKLQLVAADKLEKTYKLIVKGSEAKIGAIPKFEIG